MIRSKGMVMIISMVAVCAVWYAWDLGRVALDVCGESIAFPPPCTWLSEWSEGSLWANLMVLGATGGMMAAMNTRFNLLRTSSSFFVAYFAVTMAAMPAVAGQLSASSLAALIAMACVWLMYSIYNVRASSRRVFLVFFLLCTGALVEFSFFYYVPMFIVAIGQMRIFGFKKLLAALLGGVTPAWLAWGFGLVDIPEIPYPIFTPPIILLEHRELYPLFAATALTLVTGFCLGSLNLIKILGFNAQARSYNGLLTLLAAYTGVLAVVNFTNLPFYLTLLNASVAFQVGHFFRFTVMRRGYVVVMVLMTAYAAIYVWTMVW